MMWLRVLRWEIYKLTHRRASYIGFALCALFCAVVMLGFAYSEFKGLKRNSNITDVRAYINGFFYANFCLNISFFTLFPLFGSVIPGSMIAGEAKEGTLRTLLVRPPSRAAVFLTKAVASYLWLQVMVLFMVCFSLLFGYLVLGGGDFLVFVWEFRDFGPWFAEGGDWLWIFLVSGLGAGVSLFMIGAFALMLSAFTDNPVVAHVGTLGVFFISSIVHSLPDQLMSPDFKALMPTKHMTYWHELQQLWHPDLERFNAERFWNDIAWTTGYTAVFLIIGLVAFTRRDIKS